jgi:HAD superfamily hydrolase (TIGR01509 family)
VGGGPTRIRAVLFDLGGTLVDERDFAGWAELARGVLLDVSPEEIGHAFLEVEAEVDSSPLELDRDEFVVEFWRRVLSRARAGPVPTEFARRFTDARRASAQNQALPLFSDVRRCLDHLRAERRRLGVVSNSESEATVRRILDRAGILGYFERVVSSGTEGVAKPDPEIFRRAVGRLGLEPAEALFVGNLPRTDAVAAARAGLHAIWLRRDGTGLGDDPPEITSLLEVPLVVRQLESGSGPASPGLK